VIVEPDRIVTDYLQQVEVELEGVPTARREELLSDLREHIAVERAGLRGESSADILSIINRLGDPGRIAAEVRSDTDVRSDGTTPRDLSEDTSGWGERMRRGQVSRGQTRGGPITWVRVHRRAALVIILILLALLALAGILFFAGMSTSGTTRNGGVSSGSPPGNPIEVPYSQLNSHRRSVNIPLAGCHQGTV
jgi:hypothetical protein